MKVRFEMNLKMRVGVSLSWRLKMNVRMRTTINQSIPTAHLSTTNDHVCVNIVIFSIYPLTHSKKRVWGIYIHTKKQGRELSQKKRWLSFNLCTKLKRKL